MGAVMPWVTIRTGVFAADGQETVLREYLCDWPGGCANVAEHLLGIVPDVGMACAVCREHAATLQKRTSDSQR
jgi:hypothetical protein